MRNKFLLIGIGLLVPVFALVLDPSEGLAANDAVIGQGAQIELSDPPMTIFLQTGGQVDSLTVNTNSFSFVMSQNSSLTATSTTARILSADVGTFVTNSDCSSSGTTLTLSKTTTGTQTVIISIGASCTPTSGGGGTSGGSGATPIPTTTTETTATTTTSVSATTTPETAPSTPASETPTVESIRTKIAEIQAKIASILGQTSVAGSCSFSRSLYRRITGEDVRCLQKYLNSAGFIVTTSGGGSPGSETTLYGPLTEAAVAKWQKANGVSPAVGYFGPISRAKYNSLIGGAAETSVPSQTPAPSQTTPSNDALIKNIQAQIKAIQSKIDAIKQGNY